MHSSKFISSLSLSVVEGGGAGVVVVANIVVAVVVAVVVVVARVVVAEKVVYVSVMNKNLGILMRYSSLF